MLGRNYAEKCGGPAGNQHGAGYYERDKAIVSDRKNTEPEKKLNTTSNSGESTSPPSD